MRAGQKTKAEVISKRRIKRGGIWHLAASGGVHVAAAFMERIVSIWNVETGEQESEFDTVLDPGGKRLLMDKSGSRCVAAAYSVHGIACYSTVDGALLWQRKNLKKAQILRLSGDGQHVFCCFDSRPCAVLDMNNGQDVEKLRGVRDVYESQFEQVRLVRKRRPELQTPQPKLIGRSTYAIADVAFSPDSLCISAYGGMVRCLDTRQAKEIWRHGSTSDPHPYRIEFSEADKHLTVFYSGEPVFRRVGYSEKCSSFCGVEVHSGGDHTLKRFHRKTGRSETVANLVGKGLETVFCLGGDYLLTSLGHLVDVTDGRTVRLLPFGSR